MPKRKPKDPERSPDMPHDWIARHLQRLEARLDRDPIEIPTWEYRRAQLTSSGQYYFLDQTWGEIRVGGEWGGPDTTAFFRTRFVVPESHTGPDIFLDIDMDGGETQLCIDSRPWQGLDYYRSLVPLGEFAQAGRELLLEMEAFIVNYPYDARRHDERDFHQFKRARLVRRDRELEAFLADARFVLQALLHFWGKEAQCEQESYLRHHLEEACRAIGPQHRTEKEIQTAVACARKILHDNIFNSGLYRSPGRIHINAHSHLDLVYLWPIKETFRKNCRTITNMLSLMREFPDYRFSYSQPFLYEKLKEMYPAVFAEVRERIREGRWEVIGAMYIEPDGNLPGGESMVRHLLFGKRFLREEFGIDAQTCWLPDVFGVMYTLPQILRKSGVRYFLTAKLNIWNDTNVFPHDTFRWRGPDGSEILTHFPPTHFAQDYSYHNLHKHWQDFREKETVGENLFIYGWGDGGGGPTREMVAYSQRTDGFPGLPAAKISFAEEYFRQLETKTAVLPIWDDELYLEAHRGTYTTKSDLKRQNRKGEMLYRDAEVISALAWLFDGPRLQERLNEGWKLLLINQFHDTLPGTHVPAGVPDIKRDYADAFAIGREVRAKAAAFIAGRLAEKADLLLFNTLGWSRDGLVSLPAVDGGDALRLGVGKTAVVQRYDGRAYIHANPLPAIGWTTATFVDEADGPLDEAALSLPDGVQTPFYTVRWDDDGRFTSIYDRENGREVLAGPGNVFQLFDDNPGFKFSAWDIAYHIEEHQFPVRQTQPWTLAANGPLFAVYTSEWRLLNSTIRQEMWLYAGNRRIDFRTRVDWQDHEKLLKVAFPLRVRTRTATYDLPFGHIERPTHRNTSWEQAKFEVCGHKWADLSEGDYGVALLNDCKYGYDARENVLRLSLLRSPIRPDGESDMGVHTFTYALLPHAAGWRAAQVDRAGYELNIPVFAIAPEETAQKAAGTVPETFSLLELGARSLIVETVKQAEAGPGLVLRTFDSHGCHLQGKLQFGAAPENVVETDLMEENPQETAVDGKTVDVCYTPYEIKTHLLDFGRQLPEPTAEEYI